MYIHEENGSREFSIFQYFLLMYIQESKKLNESLIRSFTLTCYRVFVLDCICFGAFFSVNSLHRNKLSYLFFSNRHFVKNVMSDILRCLFFFKFLVQKTDIGRRAIYRTFFNEVVEGEKKDNWAGFNKNNWPRRIPRNGCHRQWEYNGRNCMKIKIKLDCSMLIIFCSYIARQW